MSTQVITIKVDPATKKQAQHLAKELGLSLSGVLKGFLKHFIREKTVTFSLQREEIPNEYFKRTLAKARKNWKEGKTSPLFTNIKDDLKWLEEQGI